MSTDTTTLRRIITSKPATSLRGRAFFVAHAGVLTLAYEGYTPTLLRIKKDVERSLPGIGPEHAGSKWPKTTLGALRHGKAIGLDELMTLRELCDEYDVRLKDEPLVLDVNALALVDYRTRSLEQRSRTFPMLLAKANTRVGDRPPLWHRKDIEHILSQFTRQNLPDYSRHVLDVRQDEDHYLMPRQGETTLVYDLPQRVPALIRDFTRDVEARLPELYRWFDPKSLHVTVRQLREPITVDRPRHD